VKFTACAFAAEKDTSRANSASRRTISSCTPITGCDLRHDDESTPAIAPMSSALMAIPMPHRVPPDVPGRHGTCVLSGEVGIQPGEAAGACLVLQPHVSEMPGVSACRQATATRGSSEKGLPQLVRRGARRGCSTRRPSTTSRARPSTLVQPRATGGMHACR
jgi:hypothetical protein